MKTLFSLIIVLPFWSFSQNFRGEITYQTTIIPKSDTLNLDETIKDKQGRITTYIITSKKYKSTYFENGEYNYSYTYDDKSKRMYDDHVDQPYITYRDSRKSNVVYYGSKKHKDSVITVLGYECYLVTSQSDYGNSKIYYSDEIRVNYKDFEGHKIGNWYNKLKEVDGGITIKSITEHDDYVEIMEAIKIEKRTVRDEEFELPNKPIAASFSALDTRVELQSPTKKEIDCYQRKVGMVSKRNGEQYKSYVTFLLQKDGDIKFVEPLEKDVDEFYKTAEDIINNCGFKFSPGKINGKPVDSEVYFPIQFLK